MAETKGPGPGNKRKGLPKPKKIPAAKVKFVVAWTVAALPAAWTVYRVLGFEPGFPLEPALSYTPYVIPMAVVAAVIAGLLRVWRPMVLALFCAVVLIWLVAPRAIGGPEDVEGSPLRVMSSNVLRGSGDAKALLELAEEKNVEILAVQESTPEFYAEMQAQGVEKLFPYKAFDGPDNVSGDGLWAREPLKRVSPPSTFAHVTAIAFLSNRPAIEVASVHPPAPLNRASIPAWRRGLESLPRAEEDPEGIPRVLLGDFNAGFDQERFRDIVGSGYQDAAEQLGSGLLPTWPARRRFLRFMPVTIDHVLYDERLGAKSYEVLDLPGSDHRTIYSELVLPPEAELYGDN